MIVKSLTICNFRNFRGEHSVDIAPNKKRRNVILIGGPNGSGKTTILDAMRLCMFGKRFNGYAEFKNNYQKYIISSKNKSSRKIGDPRFFIQLDMEVDDSYPPYLLTLKREWVVGDTDKIKENFAILRDGSPLEIIPREYWEDHITSLVPPYISDYFFFDGERVKDLAIGYNAEEILRKSIRDLIGLNLYETLHNDLGNLIDKIRRKNIHEVRLNEEISTKENEISTLNKKIDSIKNKINTNYKKTAKLTSELKNVEEKLRRTAGAYAKERKKNEDELFKLREKLNSIDDEIRQICSNTLPFIIASNISSSLLNQLKKERRLKELFASRGILSEVNQELMKRIKTDKELAKIPKKQIRIIKSELNNIFSKMTEEVKDDIDIKILHDLTSAEMDKIETSLESARKEVKQKLNVLLKQRENDLLSVKKINYKLKRVPDESFVKEYVENIASIRSQIGLLDQEIIGLYEKRQLLEEKVKKPLEEIRNLEEKVVCIEEDNRKIEISTKIRGTIKEFTDVMVSSRIKELEKIITEMYQKLANKGDMVKEIKINKKTFVPTLLDYEGGIVSKESISAGEKEIYALSILWGLSKISNKRLPIIIDSPLAKLDKSHVRNIITKFFPDAGEQVIILSHDREIDHASYTKLKSKINKAYTLSLNEENKIKDGYFYKV